MELPKILLIDDSKISRHFFKKLLKDTYEIIEASSGKEGLEKSEELPDLILLDIAMPDMDGFEVYHYLLGNPVTSEIPVIFITSSEEKKVELTGLDLGAVEFIQKSTSVIIIKKRIATHLELSRKKRLLADHNALLQEEVERKTKELENAQSEIVSRLGTALEFRAVYIGSHMKGLVPYCRYLGKAYGLDKENIDLVANASRLHDIGMIGIPDNLLDMAMNRNLNDIKELRAHTVIGEKVLSQSNSKLLEAARVVAQTHHERWDGTGYPNRLKGEDIPLFGRITAIADFFEGLVAEHPYCKTESFDDALEMVREERGGAFDPHLVDLFLEQKHVLRKIVQTESSMA